jgi:hypothetical protein
MGTAASRATSPPSLFSELAFLRSSPLPPTLIDLSTSKAAARCALFYPLILAVPRSLTPNTDPIIAQANDRQLDPLIRAMIQGMASAIDFIKDIPPPSEADDRYTPPPQAIL